MFTFDPFAAIAVLISTAAFVFSLRTQSEQLRLKFAEKRSEFYELYVVGQMAMINLSSEQYERVNASRGEQTALIHEKNFSRKIEDLDALNIEVSRMRFSRSHFVDQMDVLGQILGKLRGMTGERSINFLRQEFDRFLAEDFTEPTG